MAGEFKQCPNGHYYQGVSCPYCKTSSSNAGNNTSAPTEIFVGGGGASSQMPTEIQNGGGGIKTTVFLWYWNAPST